MNRLQAALISRGGLRCFDCSKRLNRKNLNYRKIKYPFGPKEMVPVCTEHTSKQMIL